MKTRTPSKPKKSYPGFPLFYHATGQWAKKIKGKMHYFGTDAAEAEQRFNDEKDDLYNGRTPARGKDKLTVMDLVNKFLTAKRDLIASGELSHRTWKDYYDTSERLLETLGKICGVATLTAEDFGRLRARLAKTRGPVALGNEVQRVRCIFKFAFESDLIEKPVKFGPLFKRPSKKEIRKARHEAGAKMIEAAELRKIIQAAEQPLKAMILLGVNAAYGQSDIAALPVKALDLKGGWVEFPRPKTAIPRRAKLWPETVKALREAIAERPDPQDPADAGLVFLTRQHGRRWVRVRLREDDKPAVPIDVVTLQFDKLVRSLKLKRRGLGFYTLRHVFRTVGDTSKDQPACDLIMGHARDDMASLYREKIDDERLETVANVVRAWLWPKTKK